MGLRAQFPVLTVGSAGRLGGMKAQCFLISGVVDDVVAASGHSAPGVYPLFKGGDFFGGKRLSAHWHLRLITLAEDAVHEQTVARLAGDDGSAGLTAAHGGGFRVETQSSQLRFGAVAAVARGSEDGLDVARKVDVGSYRRCCSCGGCSQRYQRPCDGCAKTVRR